MGRTGRIDNREALRPEAQELLGVSRMQKKTAVPWGTAVRKACGRTYFFFGVSQHESALAFEPGLAQQESPPLFFMLSQEGRLTAATATMRVWSRCMVGVRFGLGSVDGVVET